MQFLKNVLSLKVTISKNIHIVIPRLMRFSTTWFRITRIFEAVKKKFYIAILYISKSRFSALYKFFFKFLMQIYLTFQIKKMTLKFPLFSVISSYDTKLLLYLPSYRVTEPMYLYIQKSYTLDLYKANFALLGFSAATPTVLTEG